MRTAIGLIGLGVAGGVIPTGLAGIAHVGAVVGGTAAALALLVTVCLAAPVLIRRRSSATGAGGEGGAFPRRHSLSRSPARGV
jgi:tellurite resistance protein TehA-like permease